jgi:hypothetical protein
VTGPLISSFTLGLARRRGDGASRQIGSLLAFSRLRVRRAAMPQDGVAVLGLSWADPSAPGAATFEGRHSMPKPKPAPAEARNVSSLTSTARADRQVPQPPAAVTAATPAPLAIAPSTPTGDIEKGVETSRTIDADGTFIHVVGDTMLETVRETTGNSSTGNSSNIYPTVVISERDAGPNPAVVWLRGDTTTVFHQPRSESSRTIERTTLHEIERGEDAVRSMESLPHRAVPGAGDRIEELVRREVAVQFENRRPEPVHARPTEPPLASAPPPMAPSPAAPPVTIAENSLRETLRGLRALSDEENFRSGRVRR